MKRLRTLKSFKIFKSEIKKLKTYSGLCAFKGLSNDTTLMQIQSGRTVPLKYGDSDLFEKMDVNTKISCNYTILRFTFFAPFCDRLALKIEK
jgi:hypothetical protein